jgi:galactose mutarotase-like enzyme
VIQGLNQWLGSEVSVLDVEVAGGTGGTPGTLEVTVTYTLIETQTSQAVTVTVG